MSGTYQALGNSLFPRTYLAVYLWGNSWDRVGFRTPPPHPTHTQGSQVMLPKAHPALCYHTRPQLHGKHHTLPRGGTQEALGSPSAAGRDTRSAAWGFRQRGRMQVTQSLPLPPARPRGHSPDPDRHPSVLISRGKDPTYSSLTPPCPESFYYTVVQPLPGLLVHPS